MLSIDSRQGYSGRVLGRDIKLAQHSLYLSTEDIETKLLAQRTKYIKVRELKAIG
jgi:hypothetical protein